MGRLGGGKKGGKGWFCRSGLSDWHTHDGQVLDLPLGLEAPAMTPNGVIFLFLFLFFSDGWVPEREEQVITVYMDGQTLYFRHSCKPATTSKQPMSVRHRPATASMQLSLHSSQLVLCT